MPTPIQTLENTLLPFAFQKKEVIRLLLIALCIKGHILIEDLPGVGKTTLSKAFAKSIGRVFSRIQGTSDTLPQDIVGGEVFDQKTNVFALRKGPLFAEVVLIDEINRMHPKTQSAFLEAMEERQISIGGKAYALPKIHLILATQNPLEYDGTYPLPEAQRDRFLFSLAIGIPPISIQNHIFCNPQASDVMESIREITPLISEAEILELQKSVLQVHCDAGIAEKYLQFGEWTRDPHIFRYGLSLRSLSLLSLSLRANAFLEGRDFVIPEDGKDLIVPFCTHRIEVLNQSLLPHQIHEMIETKFHEIVG
ncbi:MAG: AAA family ATPase [Candidatus Peregrinibacteria bacterium]